MIYIILGLAAAVGLLLFIALRQAKNVGKTEERSSSNEEVIEHAEDVKQIHDRLASDDDYSKRVRVRFTRD
jgi:hypothetical protein